jgi:cellulose synthase operon protein C
MGPEETALRNLLLNRSPDLRAVDEATIMRSGEYLQPVLIDKFCLGLRNEPAVLIFDTLEELSLHQPGVLATLLDVLLVFHGRCPGLRVVLSGRYRIFDPDKPLASLSKEVWDRLMRTCIDVPIKPLTKKESMRYLTEIRRVSSNQPLADIVAKAAGNLFVLALLADLTVQGVLTADDVRDSDSAFAYLIERIIDRIPDENVETDDPPEVRRHKHTQRGLRWLLRYAVVPRRLTRKFASEVLSNFVFDELRGHTHRDETSLRSVGERYADRDRWRREDLAISFDDLWIALQSYAGSSSWVSSNGEDLELQPEIVVPMRQLLTKNIDEYCIWFDLNEAAAQYFERQATADNEREAARRSAPSSLPGGRSSGLCLVSSISSSM